jgi:hypothetical protein
MTVERENERNPGLVKGAPDDPPVDEFEFNVVSSRLAGQLDRIDQIDTKIGAVIAAVIAAIGFAITSDKSPLDFFLTLPYLVPLGLTVYAYKTQTWDTAPDPDYFSKHYTEYPQASKRTAIIGMVQAYNANKNRLETKGWYTNIGLFSAVGITVVLTVARLVEASRTPAAGT